MHNKKDSVVSARRNCNRSNY